MNLLDYLNSAKSSLFRYEGLQEYDIEQEREAVQHFLENGVFDESRMREWWDFIESKKKTGVSMQRVRLLVEPLTDYTKMELAIHRKSNKVGDDIRVITEEKLKELLGLKPQDFWLIDDSAALLMQYDSVGKYLGFTLAEDVAPFLFLKNEFLKNSISIEHI